MEGSYEDAVREYESFLARAPEDRLAPVAAVAIASIHLQAHKDTTAALASLERVLTEHRESPWAAEAARQKGSCTEAQGKWDDAAKAYMLAFDLAAGQEEDWINEVVLSAATCYDRVGNQSKIIETYSRVLDGSPQPEVAAAAMGDTDSAAESYTRIIRQYPSCPEYESAVAKRELIDKHTTVEWGPYEAYDEATRMIAAGDLQGALAKCEEVLSGSPNTSLRECAEYRKLSLETAHSADFTEGCRKLQQFIDEHPGGLRTELAQRTLDQSWSRVADLESSARENPEDATVLGALGQAYLQARSIPKGIEILEKALTISPEDPTLQLTAGYAFAQAGRTDQAAAAFGTYLETNPDDVNALNMMGYMTLGGPEPENAITYFQRYVDLAPDEANAHDSLGEGYMTLGRLQEAAAEYEKAVEIDPSFSNSHFMLGRVYQQMGEADKAASAYQRFLELVPRGPQAEQARAAIQELRSQ
jgi:tetratricopeptide (TPR) repeat protein